MIPLFPNTCLNGENVLSPNRILILSKTSRHLHCQWVRLITRLTFNLDSFTEDQFNSLLDKIKRSCNVSNIERGLLIK